MAGHLLINCLVYNGLNCRFRPSSSNYGWTLVHLLLTLSSLAVFAGSLPSPSSSSSITQLDQQHHVSLQSQPVAAEWNPSHGPQTCQRIDVVSLCTEEMNNYKVPYNYTIIPNLVGQQDISEAVASLEGFRLLVRSACAPQLKFFLCSVYLPMCTPIPDTTIVVVVPPCRPLCNEVRTKCEPVLTAFQYPWPSQINCDDFPEENRSDDMCMSGPTTEPEVEDGTFDSAPVPETNDITAAVEEPIHALVTSGPPIVRRPPPPCRQPEIAFVFINTTQSCALSCTANFITTREEKFYAEVFHGLVVGLTFLGTLLVAILFACGRRAREQERPIFMILGCLLVVAAGYAVRLAAGRQVGCLDAPDGKQSVLVGVGMDHVIPPWSCLVVFVLLFYFSLAGNIWWVVLTVAWFLSAVRGSKPDKIKALLRKCHVFVWFVPAIFTGTGIIGKYIDADELTAICSVGQQNSSLLFFLVLGPLFLITLIGTAVLLTGCILLKKRRSSFLAEKKGTLLGKSKLGSPATQSLTTGQDDKLFALCVLFLPSTAIVIGCYFTEYVRREEGHQTHPDRIQVALYFVRVVMQFIYGIVVAVWFCATAKRRRGTVMKNLPIVTTTFIPPALNGQVKMVENAYIEEEAGDYESDFYNSIAPAPCPSSITVSAQYPIVARDQRMVVADMWTQQKLTKQEMCKESMRSMPISGCPSYLS